MKQVYTVYRMLRTNGGSQIPIPLVTYEREEDAKTACKHLMAAFNELAQGILVVDEKAVGQLSGIIAQMGISGVGYSYTASPVKESLVLEARSPLVLVQ